MSRQQSVRHGWSLFQARISDGLPPGMGQFVPLRLHLLHAAEPVTSIPTTAPALSAVTNSGAAWCLLHDAVARVIVQCIGRSVLHHASCARCHQREPRELLC